jgi:glycosyltransferase involved in cell wall biosynthesis
MMKPIASFRKIIRKHGNTKIAILGSRGIPARYSGYDTLVEELSIGLAASGDVDVMVYCRSSYYDTHPDRLHGVRLFYLPAPRLKAVESLLHSFLSTVHVLFQNVDVIYFLDPANAPFCLILRLLGKKVVLHTDGLGWKRRKWGPTARRYYKFVEWVCAYTANALITDNPAMRDYYLREYRTDSVYIPYGATNRAGLDKTVFDEFRLSPKGYLLVVARLEPENNTDFIIEEYVQTRIQMPLVIVGDAPYSPRYMDRIRESADERVYFIGRVNDQAKLNALYRGAYLYIHGHEVGGTNPSLLRAMDAGVAPLAIHVPFNKAVIDDCGFLFRPERGCLFSILEGLVAHTSEVIDKGLKAKERSAKLFNWEYVIRDHKKLFLRLAGKLPGNLKNTESCQQ